MERSEREHLLLEVLQDDPVHANTELLARLAVLRVVREPAAGGLELARVEDELAAGPWPPGLGARRTRPCAVLPSVVSSPVAPPCNPCCLTFVSSALNFRRPPR